MKSPYYLNTALFGSITLCVFSSLAQATSDLPQIPVLSGSFKQAYEFHKEQVELHQSMAKFHQLQAEKYKNDGNYELQKHHKALALQHEALSRENDRVAHIHQKTINTL